MHEINYYGLNNSPEVAKLKILRDKLGTEKRQLEKKVSKMEKEIDKIEGVKEEFIKKERQLKDILNQWEEKMKKVIKIGDIIPEDFDGKIAKKQTVEIPKLSNEMDKNIKQALNLVEGIRSQLKKIDNYNSNLQNGIDLFKNDIGRKASKISYINRKLSNM